MLKLISVNIQGDNNHGTVIPFLIEGKPDVVCVQEIFQEDLVKYEEALGMKSFFKPMMYRPSFKDKNTDNKLLGPAIFTNHEVKFSFKYLIGDEPSTPIFKKPSDSIKERNVSNIVILWADITMPNNDSYRVSTTHFTWTPDGSSTAYQIEDVGKLIKILDKDLENFILVGDLNAPRGLETFSKLAEKYKDNIPLEYDSSLDPKLHRVEGLKYMVDGLFSTPEYILEDVKLVEGVSDHKAVVANIKRN